MVEENHPDAVLTDQAGGRHQRCTLAFLHHPYRSSTGAHTGKPELKHLWAQLVAGGVDLVPISSVHPSSVARAAVHGVYKMVLYPDHWVGAHEGTDGGTRDLRSIGCH